MQIGILGTGRMGAALGSQWANQGHEVFFGSREPARAYSLAESVGAGTRGGSLAEAAVFGEAVLLATIWAGMEDTIQAAGSLDGKVLIDCTLPLVNRQLEVDGNSSGGQEVARLAPDARVVKAFATIHHEHFARPEIDGQRISSFYCGDDPDAKAIVARLSEDIGLDPIDSGPLFMARSLEAMGLLAIFLSFGTGYGTDIGFRLLRNP